MKEKRIYGYIRSNSSFSEDISQTTIPLSFSKNLELKQALNSMYRAWMPLNEVVYNSIKNNVKTRVYDNNRERFLHDISTDFTILALIFREMPNMITSKESIDPVKFLKTCDIEKLKEIFLKDASAYSLYSCDDMKDSQAIMYKYTEISSQLSQKFASINSVDPLFVYTISVLRGLADCLIAWNYPRLFERALKTQANSEEKLDRFIERVLGFSPNDIIVELILSWNFNDEIRDFVDEARSNDARDKTILKCLSNGEMLAKLHEPKIFPEVINKLDDFKDEISDTNNISKVIKREVKRACEYYEKYAPEIFDLTMSIKERVKDAILAHAENKLRKNTFIFQCNDDIVNSFKKVYVNIMDDKFSKRALEILRFDTISKAGFENGCLYIYNEQKNVLTPILKIGDRELYQYREVACENNVTCLGFLVDALNCAVPLKSQGISVTGEPVDYVCSSFGNAFKKGVLYLEYQGSDVSEEDDEEIMVKFKAILRCLNECLGFSVN